MVSAQKLGSMSLILIGLVFLIQAIGIMYALVIVGSVLEAAGTYAGMYGTGMPNFTTIMIVGWVYAILQLITGLVALLTGGASLIEK